MEVLVWAFSLLVVLLLVINVVVVVCAAVSEFAPKSKLSRGLHAIGRMFETATTISEEKKGVLR